MIKSLRNKRAETGPIGAIGFIILFLLMWFIWLGPFVADIGLSTVQKNGLTGIEAFLYMNLNLIIFVCLCLFLIGFAYFGGD